MHRLNVQHVVCPPTEMYLGCMRECKKRDFKCISLPVYLIEGMGSDRSVVSCSDKHLEGERLPLRISTQLHRVDSVRDGIRVESGQWQ